MRALLLNLLPLAALALSCTAPADAPGGDADIDADADTDQGTDTGEPCVDPIDSDGDTVSDAQEGEGDFDADGVPNVNDTDDDGDNVPTYVEAGDSDPCTPPPDHDGDDYPDFLDLDSDNDSLGDADEVRRGTDPYDDDSDDDGFPDGVEVNYGSDPLDPDSGVDIDDFYVVLPYEAPEHEIRNLIFGTDIEVADVFFVVDTTGSMGGTINGVQTGLIDTIIPGVQAQIDNAQMGVAEFEDFAYGSYGSDCGGGFGGGVDRGKDHAFNLLQQVTDDFDAVQEAVDLLDQPMGCGADGAESYVEALYQSAVGDGILKGDGDAEPYAPAVECEMALDEPGARIGGACFRPGALPIVLLFGDNEFHNGPPDGDFQPYNIPDADPAPHTYPEAVDALIDIGARVIGLTTSGGWGQSLAHNQAIATDTGTVGRDGEPLAFTYNAAGDGLDEAIVDAIEELAQEVPQDVTTATEDTGGDLVDATRFIKDITTFAADPLAGIESMDEHTFYGTIPGTRLEFEVDFYNDFQPEQENPQLYRAIIVVLGNGVARLDERAVLIQIPSLTGELIF